MESHGRDAGTGADLQQVTRVLRHALAEACGTELREANTGELARVEEVLTVATQAAHEVVTLRRKAKTAPPEPERDPMSITAETARASLAAAGDPANHRAFTDSAGVAWDAFAVHPSAEPGGRARLPEPYQRGWLSFDSGRERRRLSPIPEGWFAMSDDELRAACARAEPASRRLTPPKPDENVR